MVPRGVKVKHDFLLVNRLAEPITILNLRPSCGCTSGRANPSMVAPGQTAVIEAEMDTRNFVGLKSTILYVTLMTASGRGRRSPAGSHVAYLERHRDEPRLDRFRNGHARPVADPGPDDRPDQRSRMEVRAHGIGQSGDQCSARRNGADRYVGELFADGQLEARAPAGLVRDEIRLISNDAETPSIPLMVTAWIRGDLTAAPSVLSLGQIHSAAGAQGRFVVRVVATVHDPCDRRGRRRLFDLAPRCEAPADARRDGRLQARRGDDPGRHPPHLPRPHRPARRTAAGLDRHVARRSVRFIEWGQAAGVLI